MVDLLLFLTPLIASDSRIEQDTLLDYNRKPYLWNVQCKRGVRPPSKDLTSKKNSIRHADIKSKTDENIVSD